MHSVGQGGRESLCQEALHLPRSLAGASRVCASDRMEAGRAGAETAAEHHKEQAGQAWARQGLGFLS